jgi:hypothetical protein
MTVTQLSTLTVLTLIVNGHLWETMMETMRLSSLCRQQIVTTMATGVSSLLFVVMVCVHATKSATMATALTMMAAQKIAQLKPGGFVQSSLTDPQVQRQQTFPCLLCAVRSMATVTLLSRMVLQ